MIQVTGSNSSKEQKYRTTLFPPRYHRIKLIEGLKQNVDLFYGCYGHPDLKQY